MLIPDKLMCPRVWKTLSFLLLLCNLRVDTHGFLVVNILLYLFLSSHGKGSPGPDSEYVSARNSVVTKGPSPGDSVPNARKKEKKESNEEGVAKGRKSLNAPMGRIQKQQYMEMRGMAALDEWD